MFGWHVLPKLFCVGLYILPGRQVLCCCGCHCGLHLCCLWSRQVLGGWCFGLHRLRRRQVRRIYWTFRLHQLRCWQILYDSGSYFELRLHQLRRRQVLCDHGRFYKQHLHQLRRGQVLYDCGSYYRNIVLGLCSRKVLGVRIQFCDSLRRLPRRPVFTDRFSVRELRDWQVL